MSDPREQSYYEIALTNRQVMSIFIVLLVCLLASFVSGLWIGRQGAGVRVETVQAQRIDGESAAGEGPLGEMDFFSRDTSDRVPGDAPPATDEAEPESAASREADPPPAGSGESGAQPVEPPEEPAEPIKPPADAPARRADPPAPPPAAAVSAAGQSTDPVAASDEFLYIQVFSSIDRDQAQSIVDKLKRDGYAAFLSSVEVDNRLMHRVRIGPYSQREEAEGVASQVQRRHKLSTWITP